MAAKRSKTQARRNSGNGGGTPGWVWGALGLVLGVVLILVVPRYLKRDGDDFFRPHPNPDAQPAPVADEPDAVDAAGASAAAETADAAPKPAKKSDFDFYTMLPGKEVPLSDAELAATADAEAKREAQKQAAATPAPAPATAASDTPAPAATATGTGALPAPVDTAPAAPSTASSTTARPAAPATASTPAPSPPAPKPAAPAPAREPRYLLQAGAFQASGQAEELKAKIALLGVGARVEAAKSAGKTVYRVRMGPYGSATELAEAKRKLASGGQAAIAIKVE